MKLSHFSSNAHLCVHSTQQPTDAHMKPHGLWVSVDGEYDWESWCRSEEFYKDITKHRFRINLVRDTNVLRISNATDLRAFTEKYKGERVVGLYHSIRWDAAAQHYGGIIISPYLWECRMDDDMFWYYSWDCASGCIWDHRCIQSVYYLGEVHFEEKVERDGLPAR